MSGKRVEIMSEQSLKPLLTDEFLSTLTEAALTCGHTVDYAELIDFVLWCYDLSEKPEPEQLRPYEGRIKAGGSKPP